MFELTQPLQKEHQGPIGELLSYLKIKNVILLSQGEFLFKEGDPADSIYQLAEGKVVHGVYSEINQKFEICRAEYFGCEEIYYDFSRISSAVALEDSKIIEFELNEDAENISAVKPLLQLYSRFHFPENFSLNNREENIQNDPVVFDIDNYNNSAVKQNLQFKKRNKQLREVDWTNKFESFQNKFDELFIQFTNKEKSFEEFKESIKTNNVEKNEFNVILTQLERKNESLIEEVMGLSNNLEKLNDEFKEYRLYCNRQFQSIDDQLQLNVQRTNKQIEFTKLGMESLEIKLKKNEESLGSVFENTEKNTSRNLELLNQKIDCLIDRKVKENIGILNNNDNEQEKSENTKSEWESIKKLLLDLENKWSEVNNDTDSAEQSENLIHQTQSVDISSDPDINYPADLTILNMNAVNGDFQIAKEFQNKIASVINENKSKIIVDLKNVKTIQAPLLGALIYTYKNAKEIGIEIKFVISDETMNSLFIVSRVDQIFEIYNNIESAVKSFYN